MKRTSIIATAALGTALALGAIGIGTAVLPAVAGAQGTDIAQVAEVGTTQNLHGHPRLRDLARQEFELAADTIGIPAQELRQDVKGGQSISEVAEAHGVSTQTVVDAVVNDLSSRLDKAVTDGKISQERADKIKQRLPERITNLVNRHRVVGQPAN
jgi:molybdopterin converting factor small subunit